VENKGGMQAIHIAALNGYGHIVELLLTRGADPASPTQV
jgi:ankyrin repeat protein